MNAFEVTFQDSTSIITIVTSMNATLEEARAYYLGHKFQFGDSEAYPHDKLMEAVHVEPAEAV